MPGQYPEEVPGKTQTRLTRSLSFVVLVCLLALTAPAPAAAQEPYTRAIAGGDAQSACLATPFADPLLVTVKDALLTAVEGVVVTFAAPADGSEYMIVGCGGGRAHATATKSRFAAAIPGFTSKALRQVVGPAEVATAATAQRDALSYVHQQTVDNINAHVPEDEIAAAVALPADLAASPYNQEFAGAMPSGSAAMITVQVKRKDTGIAIVNTATIASSIFDIDLSDNSATVTVP